MHLDEELRGLLRGNWTFETAPPALLALGPPALDRLLDAPSSVFFPTDTEWRDYGMYRQHAVAAFAKRDLDSVLAAMKKRKWTDAAIGLSGVGLVRDARVVPLLVRLVADPEPMRRQEAVELLGGQRDPDATAAVLRALRDRSSNVRRAAVHALGEIGDPTTVDALEEAARRWAKSPLIEAEVAATLRKVRDADRPAGTS